MEKAATMTTIEEEGFLESIPLSDEKSAGAAMATQWKNQAVLRQRKVKGLGLTIFGLLMMTFVFLALSYEYEPIEGVKTQPMARLLRTGTPLRWHWSRS